MSAILIKGGKVVDPAQNLDALKDILINDDTIAAIGKPGELDAKAKSLKAEVLQASKNVICPGFIDLNARICPNDSDAMEHFQSASDSALMGGFTSVVCMPSMSPINDNAFAIDFLIKQAKDKSRVKVLPVGALTLRSEGEQLAEVGLMKKAGIVAVADDRCSVMNSYLMRKALEYVQVFDLPVLSFAHDQSLVGKGVMDEGAYSCRLGLRGIPAVAEEIIVHRDLALLGHTGGQIHFSSISTKGSIEAIRDAKEAGLNVTAETNPQYFTLSSDMIESYDANLKCMPPLRHKSHIRALKEGIKSGIIDCIASKHRPVSAVDKDVVFEQATPGMLGLETAFPTTMRLVDEKVIDINRLVSLLSWEPAKVLNLEDRGNLKVGSKADLLFLDLEAEFTYEKEMIKTPAKNSPFIGQKFKGKVKQVIIDGKLIS